MSARYVMIRDMNILKKIIRNLKSITCQMNIEIEKRDSKFSIDKF